MNTQNTLNTRRSTFRHACRGGTAVVYEALDTHTMSRVAVKCMNTSKGADGETRMTTPVRCDKSAVEAHSQSF